MTAHALPAARWWFATFLFGVAVLLFGASLSGIFPASGHAVEPGYGSPVLAFEFARSQDDLVAIFGADTDPLQDERVADAQEKDMRHAMLVEAMTGGGPSTTCRLLGVASVAGSMAATGTLATGLSGEVRISGIPDALVEKSA